MNEKIVIVFDCGATNIRAVAISEHGDIVAQHSVSNSTQPDPYYKGGLIWNVNEIWQKFCICSKNVIRKINSNNIIGITVTTFGVNGALMSKNGQLKYPIISWQCQRTLPIMQNIGKYIAADELYNINGLQDFSYNTINNLIWLKENKNNLVEQSDYFVFISSIFLYYLSGEFVTDTTMAGTSMLTDITTGKFSEYILKKIGFTSDIFPKLVEPGTIIGKTTEIAAKQTGLPKDIAVIATGHDTQFALIGSGAKLNQAILSSGTWEVLMARTQNIKIDHFSKINGITTEFDAFKSVYNPGVQWLASGILEWIKKMFYSNEASQDNIYEIMIKEAENVKQNSVGFDIDFLNNNGSIKQLGLHTNRAEIYRAALMALSKKTKNSIEILEKIGGFKADSLICVGGGSKNNLWNKLRAKQLDIPVKVANIKETTVLGASIMVNIALGNYKNLEDADNFIKRDYTIINPE